MAAERVAATFTKRGAYSGEAFEVHEIVPLSDSTGAAIYSKSSGKRAIAFFRWSNHTKDWSWFFPSDEDILGMQTFFNFKQMVERHNYLKSIDG